jgi:hypothetical protein
MLGAKSNVYCRPLLHFPHNYNYVSRATMYNWFNRHLKLGLDGPVIEEDWEPLTPEEYTVWNEQHPQPPGGDDYERSLTRYLADRSDAQIAALSPQDSVSLDQYRQVVGGAVQTIIGRGLPNHENIQRKKIDKEKGNGYIYFEDTLRLEPPGEELPVLSLFPTKTPWSGKVVIWVDGAGKRGMFDTAGQVQNEILRLLDAGASVVAADLFQQGEFLPGDQPLKQQRVVKNPRESAAYTFCYNDTLFAARVHDILTVVAWVRNEEHEPKQVDVVGVNGAGPLVVAARAVAGGAIDRAAVDTAGFRFADLTGYRDVNFLPGAVKYGDLAAMLALSAPHPLWIAGEGGKTPQLVTDAYAAAGEPKNVVSSNLQNASDAAVDWLLAQ